MGRALQGRRLTGPLLAIALILLATHAPKATARGLRKDTEGKEENKQQVRASKPTTTATSTATIPPQQATAASVGATFSYDPAEAAAALEEEIDQAQLSEYEALKTLHEDMLIGLMSDSSSIPPSSSSSSSAIMPTAAAEELELNRYQIPNNDAVQTLHEDMLISLMSSSSSRPQQAFVPQPADGHRRLQFRGIPGIPRIPGIPGIPRVPGMPGIPRGIPGMGYVRTGARVINQGVNVVRQGANTAQEMNQMRQDYERRCNLYPGEAEYLYEKALEQEQQQQKQQQQQQLEEGGRKLQQLINMGANALVRGMAAYGRDAACPDEEQRQQYLQLKKEATDAYETMVAPHKEIQLQQHQHQRILLQQWDGEVELRVVGGGRGAGLAHMHRQARAAYSREVLLEEGKQAMPGPVEGAEVVARQEEFKDSNSAIDKTNKNAEWLKEVEGKTGEEMEGKEGKEVEGKKGKEVEGKKGKVGKKGKARVTWDDLDDLDIFDKPKDERDDGDVGPF